MTISAQEGLDTLQALPKGVATGVAVHSNRDPGEETRLVGSRPVPEVERVVAFLTEHDGATQAGFQSELELVVASATVEQVGTAVADEVVVPRTALEHVAALDSSDLRDLAPFLHATFVEVVATDTAIRNVVAIVTEQLVVAGACHKTSLPRPPMSVSFPERPSRVSFPDPPLR